uniref:Uncharacterized protein n=1 Tax=Arundo donax TaxID=35708 RepID=A0A0A9D6V4_ARUDO
MQCSCFLGYFSLAHVECLMICLTELGYFSLVCACGCAAGALLQAGHDSARRCRRRAALKLPWLSGAAHSCCQLQ